MKNIGADYINTFDYSKASSNYVKAGSHLLGKHEQLTVEQKQYINPDTFKVGYIDNYGNYLIELPDHHVYIEEKGFFSKIMWGDKIKQDKESLIEAFSKQINL